MQNISPESFKKTQVKGIQELTTLHKNFPRTLFYLAYQRCP